MSGFGNWNYNNGQNGGDSGGGGGANDFFGGALGSLQGSLQGGLNDIGLNSDQLLPLYEGMQPVSFQSIREGMEAQMPKKILGMGYQQRFKVFTALLLLSALFFALAFGVGMPMITIRPQKFAISFTMGSLMFMGSFGILKGPMEHLKSMCAGDRMFFTTIYVGSMLATLYFTFNIGGPQGYIIVMGASGVQLLALLYYLVSFLPGGAAGMRILLAAMCKLLQPVFIMCAKMQAICMAKCCKFLVRRSFGAASSSSTSDPTTTG